MFYNRSKNPEKPEWIAVRGSSSIEGGHSYYHASLPGTNYSADLAGTIVACRLGDASIKASARHMGSTAFSLNDAYAQHCKKQLCKPEWHYSLPNSVQVPDHTDELFGTDYVPGMLALEQAKADMVRSKQHVAELAAEEEREFKELAASTGIISR